MENWQSSAHRILRQALAATHLLAVALLLSPAPALADVIHLKNGNWFEGVVIEESEERVVVSTASGDIPLKWDILDRIDRGTEEKNLGLKVGAALKTENALRAL